VYRAAAALPFTAQAQESVRRVAVLMSTTPDEPESQALQSGTSLNSFSLVRVVMGNPPAGRSHWIRSSTRPRRQGGGLTWLTRHICGQKAGGACSPLSTSHVLSKDEAKFVFERGCEQLILGSGQMGNVHLSPEAEAYFAKKGCEVLLQPTPEAIGVFNRSHAKKIGLFHVTC
jgi:hypothetical protein